MHIEIDLPDDLHPSSRRFAEIMVENVKLHLQKGQDYGTDADPFANVRASEGFGVPAWVGCMIRANDKMKRLQAMATRGSLANESVIDSFKDLSVYAVIGQVLFEQDQDHDQDELDRRLDALRKNAKPGYSVIR